MGKVTKKKKSEFKSKHGLALLLFCIEYLKSRNAKLLYFTLLTSHFFSCLSFFFSSIKKINLQINTANKKQATEVIFPEGRNKKIFTQACLLRKSKGKERAWYDCVGKLTWQGELKCSSQGLTLEFAGNRTGLRAPKGRGELCVQVCMCADSCPHKSYWVFRKLSITLQVYLCLQSVFVLCAAFFQGRVFVCLCSCS